MRLISLLFVFMLSGGLAHAGLDIECINGDCLTYGWDITDTRNGNTSSIECVELDCLTQGWISIYKNQDQVEVRCKEPGCFQNGWRAYDIRTNRQIADITCLRSFADGSDCLRNGWETQDVNVGRYITRCQFSDCTRFGWESRAPGFQPNVARCKEGGCFRTGWTTTP